MKSLYTLLLFFFLCPCICFSQDNGGKPKSKDEPTYKKKNIKKEYKANWKAANYLKSDEVLQNAFKKYKESNDDPELLCMASNVKYQLYLEENRKIFLNNKGDTAKFFNYLYDTHLYGLKCDSTCNNSQIKEGAKKHYRSDINIHLSSMRNNLLSGGKFFLKKKNYNDAFRFFDMYLSTNHNPLVYRLKGDNSPSDSDSLEVTKLAVLAAYGSENYNNVMKYYSLAVSDTVRKELLMEIGAKSALQLNDSTTYHEILNGGFDEYPQNDYFKASLIQYYHNRKEHSNTLDVIERCIAIDSNNVKYLKLKGNELMAVDSVDLAKDVYAHVLELDSTDFEIASVLGNIYLDKARSLYNTASLKIGAPHYRENRRRLTELYKSAEYYLAIARRQCPERPELWKDGLTEVYYKLNNGKELKKIESIM